MNRITFNPDQCGGHPCIRGMRIRVTDVLDLLANGLSFIVKPENKFTVRSIVGETGLPSPYELPCV